MPPVEANPDREAVITGFLRILFDSGLEAVPEKYRKATVAEAWRRLRDPLTGFLFFWVNLAFIQIKGQGSRAGWQRACPNGEPRVHATTGRDWRWQLEVATWLPRFTELLILKARQIGFSFIVANMIVWAAIVDKEQTIAVIANKLQSAKRLLRRAREVYYKLPAWVRDEVYLTNPAISRLEFSNGSTVEPYSGDPDAARSDAASWVFVDEIGEIKQLLEFYAATESVAGDGGRFVMFGTAKDNGLEDWVNDGLAGDLAGLASCLSGDLPIEIEFRQGEERAFAFMPYYVHPGRDEDWHTRRRKAYRGNLAKFDREYPSTPGDAFTATGAQFFARDPLRAQAERERKVWEARDRSGSLVQDGADPRRVKFIEDPFGSVVIHASPEEFAEAVAAERPWVIGADCAGDRPTGDFHAASGLHLGLVPSPVQVMEGDFDEGLVIPHRQLVTIHGYMDGDQFAEQLVRLGWLLRGALLAIENNGVGAGVIKTARRLGYPYLFVRRVGENRKKGEKAGKEYGWHTDNATKHIAYGEVERCLRHGWTEVRDPDTIVEMGNIVSLGRNGIGAREPKHDDRPDGLAIAHGVIPYARQTSMMARVVDTGPKPDTMEWLLAQFDAMDDAEAAMRSLGYENVKIGV